MQGGGLRDSFLVDGVAFKKTFSYAGFEMQPKAYERPGILLLNIELELKSEKENAEVRGPRAPQAPPAPCCMRRGRQCGAACATCVQRSRRRCRAQCLAEQVGVLGGAERHIG